MHTTSKALLCMAATVILAGCATGKAATGKVCPPAEIIRVPVPYYVPVDDSLTSPLPIAHGGLADMPAVSRDRRKVLEQANIDRAAVRKLQGTAVPDKVNP